MAYQVGQQLEMKVLGIRRDSAGYNYIALYDENYSKECKVYNILKCQHDSLPKTLYVQVKSIDAFGNVKFQQDEGRLYREHYREGKLNAFTITGTGEDWKSHKPYYIIEDSFASHRYYFYGEQKYQIGDDCILEIEGFTDKGFLKLKEGKTATSIVCESFAEDVGDDGTSNVATWHNFPILDVPDENEILELKSSIVFPPDSKGNADIDKQMYNILKEITAFMNTKGGELYIGVHDKTKRILGIKGDYCHLNDGEDDFAGSYNQNNDGYQLKIRNSIDKHCPSLANSLVTIEFPTIEGCQICKISVKPARRPIFLSGTQIYIRQGNRLKLLKSDEITFYITERMTISIKEVLDTEEINISSATIDINNVKQAMREILNERHVKIAKELPKPKDVGETDYWIVWFQDGSWIRQREKSNEQNVYLQIPVLKNASNPILVFCYASCKVNVMQLSIFKKGVNLNTSQNKGWRRDGEKPIAIFLAAPSDYLVGYVLDVNGIEYVKALALTDFTQTASATNQGSSFAPNGNKLVSCKIVGAEHKSHISHLIGTKSKKSIDIGIPLSSIGFSEEIDYIENL